MTAPIHTDPVRAQLAQAIGRTPGMDMAKLSRLIGRNSAYIQQFLERNSPRELKETDRLAIIRALGLGTNDLLSKERLATVNLDRGAEAQLTGRGDPPSQPFSILSGASGRMAGPRDVKILGHAKGGTQGVFVDNGNIQGYAVRPDVLSGSNDGYAIYCHDRSMEPAIHSGWLCYVDPARPVQPGDDVVIQLRDGQAYIKRYVRRTQRALMCQQYNPAEPVEYPADQVRSVHLIVNANRVRT